MLRSRKRKKIEESEDEKGKNEKVKIETLKEETLEQGNEGDKEKYKKKKKKKGYYSYTVNNLSDLRFGSFSRQKKKKTQSVSHQQLQQHHPHALKKGDTLNLSELLFTQHRDFLITYHHRDSPVQAKHLEDKVLVLHFVPLIPWSEYSERFATTVLLDIYHALHPKGGFEVVLIGVEVHTPQATSSPLTLEECFEEKFSIMPWPAIPFSDIKSSTYWETVFPLSGFITDSPASFVIDPTGVVLQCNTDDIFHMYGAHAYPFTDQRMQCLLLEYAESLKHPSMTELLASSERDYLIDNKNQAVPLHNLEDKVVGLYFYEDYPNRELISEIQKAYEQLAQEKNFEIVLVFIHDSSFNFEYTTEESYWETLKKMPWLALPFKDAVCKKLQRVFNYPLFTDGDEDEPDHSLVIIGPHGKFVEPYGADILKRYGSSAYPFTRKRAAELEVERIKELKLNMFWGRKMTFIQKNGSMVELSELEGKRIITIVEDDQYSPDAKFWRKLRARYLQVKGTSNEFEVIHICKNKKKYSYGKNIAIMSWLRYPSRHLPRRWGINELKILERVFRGGVIGVLAFDHEGRVVRRTHFEAFGRGKDFPFVDMKKEFLRELVARFEWEDWKH